MNNSYRSQKSRIKQRLLHGDEVPSIELHRIGSGKEHGFCASLTRRISEIRDEGYNVICRKKINAEGQVHTFYTLVLQTPPEKVI